jgi:hypothetical protein
MNMSNTIFLKVIFYLTIIIIALPKGFKNWIKIRILKNHRKYSSYGNLKISKNIAVLVTYPGTTTFGSVDRLANWFEEGGYFLILVINENSLAEIWKSKLTKNQRLVIIRPNIGGDFGGYKLALKIISPFRRSIENLVISNDSMLYGPSNKKSIMKLIDTSSIGACTSLFLNMQTTIHGPSMILKFGKETLERNEFWNFWKKYYPYTSKRKIVYKGEHQLTKIVGWQNINPVFSSQSIRQSMKLTKSEMIQLVKWISRTDRELLTSLNLVGSEQDHWFLLNFAFENFHISNSIGLFASRSLGAPLKLDLAREGLTTKDNLLNAARKLKVNEKEVDELRLILDSKTSYLSRNFYEQILDRKVTM